MRSVAIVGAIAGALVVAACSSFSGSSEATDPGMDGSAGDNDGGGVPGQAPAGSVALTVAPGKQTWVRNRQNTVDFTVARGDGVNGRVRINIGGLPKGSTAPEVAIAPGVTTGKMVFMPSADVPTGDLTLTLDAVLDGSIATASLPIDGFMRGAPGDVDTTFATSGVISIPAKEVSTVAVDGRVYVIRNDKTTERYTAEGTIDPTFGTNGRGTYFANSGVASAVKVTTSNVYALFNVSVPGYRAQLWKASLDGVPDAAFGQADTTGTSDTGYPGFYAAIAFSTAGDPTAIGVGSGCNSYCGGGVAWFTAAGKSSAMSDTAANLPARLTAGAFDSQGLLVVGEDTLGRVLAGYQHYDTLRFPGGHLSVGANISLFGIHLEGASILVSGVNTSTGTPFMAKFQPNAAGPFAGFTFAPAPVAFDSTFGTKSFLAADGTILHVGREKNATTCAVTRYDAMGKSDPGFGTNGVARLQVTPCSPGGVYVQPDGKIIVDAESLGTAPAVSTIVRIWN